MSTREYHGKPRKLNRTRGWIAGAREKVSRKISTYREKRRLGLCRVSAKEERKSKDANQDDDEDADEETACLVKHSRLNWPASEWDDVDQDVVPLSRSQLTLDLPSASFGAWNVSCSVLSEPQGPAQTAWTTRSPSPSPSIGHDRRLQHQKQNYAHNAWTHPDAFVHGEQDEVYRRVIVRRVEKAAADGAFNGDAITSRFATSYCHRPDPAQQAFASTDFRRRSEAKVERRKLKFELMQRRDYGSVVSFGAQLAGPSTSASQQDHRSDGQADMSRFGNVVGEVMKRGGGINGVFN